MKAVRFVESSLGSWMGCVYEQVVLGAESFVVSFVNERWCRGGVVEVSRRCRAGINGGAATKMSYYG